ncbi:MAG: hypothetical protein AMK70_01165 [Nitrospira bacterium SG8_35_1]|nr:MAG: hypothetical protein AMK70_01165 [Nitrospira bacterium SG8_35_1]
MKNKESSKENKREHYRIRYPLSFRPVLKFAGKKFEVIDISESGIKFYCENTEDLKAGQEVQGTVTFNDGKSLILKGNILRIYKRTAIVWLSAYIPFRLIIREQRYLKTHYPDHFED